MRKLSVFNNVTLDGYFADANGDFSWAYNGPADAAWNDFVADNARGGGVLLLGRITSFGMTTAGARRAAGHR